MVLVELKSLSYWYRTSIYAVDRVNGTMYGTFSVGYKIILEKATVIPQFQLTPIEDEYRPAYVNTLPGASNIVTPITKSMPVTQASQMPMLPNVPSHERDILEPMSNKRERSTYLEKQMQGMSSVKTTFGYAFIGKCITWIYRPTMKNTHFLSRMEREKETWMGVS